MFRIQLIVLMCGATLCSSRSAMSAVTVEVELGADGRASALYDASGTLTKRIVHGRDPAVAEEGAAQNHFETRFNVQDHLGSTNAVVNIVGDVLGGSLYWSYGLSMLNEGQRACTRWASERHDSVSHWYDLRARHYDPMTARFQGVDRKADLYSSLSPYHYALNNPTKYRDPSGEVAFLAPMLTGAAAGAAQELVMQTGAAMLNGQSFTEGLKGIEWSSVAKASVEGAIPMGVLSKLGKVTSRVLPAVAGRSGSFAPGTSALDRLIAFAHRSPRRITRPQGRVRVSLITRDQRSIIRSGVIAIETILVSGRMVASDIMSLNGHLEGIRRMSQGNPHVLRTALARVQPALQRVLQAYADFRADYAYIIKYNVDDARIQRQVKELDNMLDPIVREVEEAMRYVESLNN